MDALVGEVQKHPSARQLFTMVCLNQANCPRRKEVGGVGLPVVGLVLDADLVPEQLGTVFDTYVRVAAELR